MRILMWYLIIINVVTWITYGLDKWKAKAGKWRIPERTLLLLALIGGSVGALAGMMLFRHKTKKAKFFIVRSALRDRCGGGAAVDSCLSN